MSENLLPPLPFPTGEPVHALGVGERYLSYSFTLPLSVFTPAVGRLSEGNGTTLYQSYMRILSMLIHLFRERVGANGHDKQRMKCRGYDDLNRWNIYLEYLVSDGVSVKPEDVANFKTSLINCVGIRFHFIYNHDKVEQVNQNDDEGDCVIVNDADLIPEEELGGGTSTCFIWDGIRSVINDQSPCDEQGKKKKGYRNPFDKANSCKGVPARLYDFYLCVTDIKVWFMDCNTYMGASEVSPADYLAEKNNWYDPNHGPMPAHPFYPQNIFSEERSFVPNTHRYQRETSLPKVAFPCMTFAVPPVMWSPIALFATSLPYTTQWSHQKPSSLEETLRTFSDQYRMERYYTSNFVKKNDLKDIRRSFQLREDDIKRRTSGATLKREMATLSDETVRCLQGVWCDTANVSDPIKLMYRFCSEIDTWSDPNVDTARWDKDLSYFGNMMATEYWTIEYDMGFSTTHSIFFRVMVCAMNAYRYKASLHCNILMLGQGATGKSHILDTISDILIPGTTGTVTHQTEKAVSVDTDNNDHISLYHEAPPGFLGAQDKHSDLNTGSSILKDMMTRCEVVTDTIQVDLEMGRRHRIKCTSECVGVLIMATNERADVIPEALGTRMSNITVDTVDRPGFNVIDKTAIVPTEENEKNKLAYVRRWRIRQVMVNMVEKAIYVGCLKDVDMTIPERMYHKMVNYMENEGLIGDSQSVRGKSFLMNFIRTLTIIHAVDKYANYKKSPGYNKPITFRNLLAIQPYLLCSEEVALFCLTLCQDAVIDINTFRVVEALSGAYSEFFIRESGSTAPRLSGGTAVLQCSFLKRQSLYSRMYSHVMGGSFNVRMSKENLIVAYRKLAKQSFRGSKVLCERDEDGIIEISEKYIKSFFRWDVNLARYVIKLDINNIIYDAFVNSYLNKHMPKYRKFILGCAVDTQAPFILETRSVVPNDNNEFIWHDRNINLRRNLRRATQNSKRRAEKHLEVEAMSEYSKEHGKYTMEVLYGHSDDAPPDDTIVYPTSILNELIQSYDVSITNKRYLSGSNGTNKKRKLF